MKIHEIMGKTNDATNVPRLPHNQHYDAGKWFDVNEILPEDDIMVVVYDGESNMFLIGSYHEEVGSFVDYDDCAFWGARWMYLPNVYVNYKTW